MLAVVPSRERSARGTEILSSAWTGGTFFIIIIIIPHRGVAAQGTEPPTPPCPSQVLTCRLWKVLSTVSSPGMLSLSTRVT